MMRGLKLLKIRSIKNTIFLYILLFWILVCHGLLISEQISQLILQTQAKKDAIVTATRKMNRFFLYSGEICAKV